MSTIGCEYAEMAFTEVKIKLKELSENYYCDQGCMYEIFEELEKFINKKIESCKSGYY